MYAIEAPDIAEARGGLMQVANVIDNAPAQIFHQGVVYQTAIIDGHTRFVPTDGSNKVFDQTVLVEGAPFSLYRGVDYSMFQRGLATPGAKEIFKGGETYGVEQALQTLVLNERAVDISPTAGTAVTKLEALGLLEQYAADHYAGLPVIHGNRYAVSLFPLLNVDTSNWTLHTSQGTPVANGGGYGSTGPGGVIAAPGTAWMYVTGQVNIWRSDVAIAEGFDLAANRTETLAEAQYVPTVDGIVAAVLVGI